VNVSGEKATLVIRIPVSQMNLKSNKSDYRNPVIEKLIGTFDP
jgi:hypothetical protein